MTYREYIKDNLKTPGAKTTLIISFIYIILTIIDVILSIIALSIQKSNLSVNYDLVNENGQGQTLILVIAGILSILFYVPGVVCPLLRNMVNIMYYLSRVILFYTIISLGVFILYLVNGNFMIFKLIDAILGIIYFFSSGLLYSEISFNT